MPPHTSEGEQPARPMIGAMWKGPGPAKYYLPSTVGYVKHDFTKKKAAGYIFGVKLSTKDYNKSPGPAAYKITDRSTRFGSDGTPKYSLHYRPKDHGSFRTPAPSMKVYPACSKSTIETLKKA